MITQLPTRLFTSLALWTDQAVLANHCSRLNNGLRIDHRILSYLTVHLDVCALGVDNGDTAEHQVAADPLLHDPFGLCELNPIVLCPSFP